MQWSKSKPLGTLPDNHRSFSFQEFSQRYSDDIEFTDREIRLQDQKNRQNSIQSDELDHGGWNEDVDTVSRDTEHFYRWWIEQGVAKECARVVLPEGLTMSTLYVNGTLRSWLHYLQVRDDPGLARKIKEALAPAFPKIIGGM